MRVLIPFLFFGAALAQSPSGFEATGSMTTPRIAHTATLLPNGKVLIAGGTTDFNSVLASAELYDPASRTFTPTGSMITGRAGHTATLLANGKVLIAEGATLVPANDYAVLTAELYDPATGTFTPTGSPITLSETPNATLLPSGEVLVVSLNDQPEQLYDPSTGGFSLTGADAAGSSCGFSGCSAFSVQLLPDGTVLVVGAGGNAELYDPAQGAFRATASTLAPGRTTATLLTNGKVLFAGGEGASGQSAELYDPVTRLFTYTGSMACDHGGHTSTLLANRLVLIAGGGSDNCPTVPSAVLTADAELYDFRSGTFFETARLKFPRGRHTATLLNDGTVLIAGGYIGTGDTFPTVTATAELYLPVQTAPITVQIVNDTHPGTNTFSVGDSFHVAVSGTPNQAVSFTGFFNGAEVSGTLGVTDAGGGFVFGGVLNASNVGSYIETWYVGRVAATPTLTFTVGAGSAPGGPTVQISNVTHPGRRRSWWAMRSG